MDYTKGRRASEADLPLSEEKLKQIDSGLLKAAQPLAGELANKSSHITNRSFDERMVGSQDHASHISVDPPRQKYERQLTPGAADQSNNGSGLRGEGRRVSDIGEAQLNDSDMADDAIEAE